MAPSRYVVLILYWVSLSLFDIVFLGAEFYLGINANRYGLGNKSQPTNIKEKIIKTRTTNKTLKHVF